MDKIITSNDLVYLFRIFLAICAGAVIGYEREHRYKVAGLRTHILISLASALMMIISKYAFFDVLNIAGYSGLGLDVSRVAAGIIAGMGIFQAESYL
ncbi:MAG: MgtC/SapB family protein [Lachnospiraceae bacterium]|nr:MgtC/SapB family protein [Lachnospiraceae bacterium]